MMRSLLLLFVAVSTVGVFAPGAATAADWHLAETENFRLYSLDSEDNTREYAEELERLDQAMRILSGIGPAKGPVPDYNKVTVYRFGEGRDMGRLIGARSVGGFFRPLAGQPLAFVPRSKDKIRGLGQKSTGFELDPRGVLYHEYAHFFMNHHAPAAYPAWYSEGFAELFYTIELGEDRFIIGEPPAVRAFSLGAMSADTRKMFGSRMDEEVERIETARVYGHGWLLTSYLLLHPQREGQLNAFLKRINSGTNSREAAEEIFGDLGELDDELDDYRRARARILKVPYYDTKTPEVAVRGLTEAEEEVMDLVVESRSGVTEKEARGQLNAARNAVEKYPDSPAVLRAALEVAFDSGNLDEAEALADRILQLDDRHIEAAIYKGDVSIARAAEDPAHYAEARRRFAQANAIDHSDPRALYGYYRSHALDDVPITDTVAIALENAYAEAQYDRTIRRALGHLLLTEGRDEEAFVIMTPLINDPHSPAGKEMVALFNSDKEDDRAELMERLMPRPHGYEPPEDEED